VEERSDRFRRAYWAIVHNLDLLRLRAWEERGLSLPKLRLLFLLRAQPGLATHTLAADLGVTSATVSELVDKLVRAELVERGQRADDRRSIPLSLTVEGQTAVGEIRQGNRAYLADLAEALGDDLGPVTAALERLAMAIERRPASPEASRGEATP